MPVDPMGATQVLGGHREPCGGGERQDRAQAVVGIELLGARRQSRILAEAAQEAERLGQPRTAGSIKRHACNRSALGARSRG